MAVQSSSPSTGDLELRVCTSDARSGSLEVSQTWLNLKNGELERLHKTCTEQSRQIETLHTHIDHQLLELENLRSERDVLEMQVKELQTSRPSADQLSQRSDRGSYGLKRKIEEELKATDQLLIERNTRFRELERSAAHQRKEIWDLRNQIATRDLQESHIRTRCQELEDLVKSKDELILAFERVLNTKLEPDIKAGKVWATTKSLEHKQQLWSFDCAMRRKSCSQRSRLRNRRCTPSQPCQPFKCASFLNMKTVVEADRKLKHSWLRKSPSMPLPRQTSAETEDHGGDSINNPIADIANDVLKAPLSACAGG